MQVVYSWSDPRKRVKRGEGESQWRKGGLMSEMPPGLRAAGAPSSEELGSMSLRVSCQGKRSLEDGSIDFRFHRLRVASHCRPQHF